MKIHQNLRMRARKFEKPRRHPERSESFRACDPDFTPKRLCKHVAPSDNSQRRLFHLLCTGQEVMTIRSQADAITMAREQHSANLVFQLLNSSRDAVTGHAQPDCCGAETA